MLICFSLHYFFISLSFFQFLASQPSVLTLQCWGFFFFFLASPFFCSVTGNLLLFFWSPLSWLAVAGTCRSSPLSTFLEVCFSPLWNAQRLLKKRQAYLYLSTVHNKEGAKWEWLQNARVNAGHLFQQHLSLSQVCVVLPLRHGSRKLGARRPPWAPAWQAWASGWPGQGAWRKDENAVELIRMTLVMPCTSGCPVFTCCQTNSKKGKKKKPNKICQWFWIANLDVQKLWNEKFKVLTATWIHPCWTWVAFPISAQSPKYMPQLKQMSEQLWLTKTGLGRKTGRVLLCSLLQT